MSITIYGQTADSPEYYPIEFPAGESKNCETYADGNHDGEQWHGASSAVVTLADGTECHAVAEYYRGGHIVDLWFIVDGETHKYPETTYFEGRTALEGEFWGVGLAPRSGVDLASKLGRAVTDVWPMRYRLTAPHTN